MVRSAGRLGAIVAVVVSLLVVVMLTVSGSAEAAPFCKKFPNSPRCQKTTAPTTTAPTTTTVAPPSSTGFPDASNTGVQSGVTLTAYTGPMTITVAGTVIDAKLITGYLVIKAANVTITRSKVVGNIDADTAGATLTIADSEVDGGRSQQPAVGYDGITMRRVEVRGSRVSVLCGFDCDIQDSWLHAQYIPAGSTWHVNGYVSNGGSNVLVRHNTLACDVSPTSADGGCTAPGAIFGDFDPLSNITFDNNLFVASPGSSYCLYAGHNPGKPYGSNPTGIVITGNIFQRGATGKCGFYGAVTSFLAANGNVFTGNGYDDGTPVPL